MEQKYVGLLHLNFAESKCDFQNLEHTRNHWNKIKDYHTKKNI